MGTDRATARAGRGAQHDAALLRALLGMAAKVRGGSGNESSPTGGGKATRNSGGRHRLSATDRAALWSTVVRVAARASH